MQRALFFLAFVLVLAGLWWIARGKERQRTSVSDVSEPAIAPGAIALDPELTEPGRLLQEETADSSDSAPAERTRRRAAPRSGSGTRRRAPIHGRLLIAPGDEPLAEVLTVRLRTGDLSLSENVVTRPDGSFSSTKAFPKGFTLATVLRPAGDDAFEHEAWFDPASDEDWLVRGPWPTFARGRVVDRTGEPLADVDLVLPHRVGGETIRVGTGADGRFRLQGLAPGPYRVLLCRGFEQSELSFTAFRGPNELGDVVARFRERAGEISGTLRGSDYARALVMLEDRASGYVDTRIAEPDEDEPVTAFCFQEVLAGDYWLSIVGLDGARYAPAALSVVPPASGLRFELAGDAQPFRPPVRGLDARRHSILTRVGGRWFANLEGLARDDVERWIVVGEQFRPVAGRPASGASAETEIDLEAGWGRAFLFVQAAGGALERGSPPLPGVAVLADGRTVSVSDADGLALVRLAGEPDALDYALAGWKVLETDDERGFSLVAMQQE